MDRQKILLDSIAKYYQNNPAHFVVFKEIVEMNSSISLRLLDWFVTNYAKQFRIVYPVRNRGETEDNYFFVFSQYRAQLKAYSKKCFDPFCRRSRIKFVYDGQCIDTTVGQLNFFRWAIQHQVVDYVRVHQKDIEEHMHHVQDKQRKTGKRTQLSKDTTRYVQKFDVPITISF